MGLTGKYDFSGIKRLGAKGLLGALSSTGWGATIVKMPIVGTLVEKAAEMFVNWLANEGLLVMNLGAIFVEGEFDQKSFDAALAEGFDRVKLGRDKITPEEGKKIDDEVRNAAKRFIRFNPD